MELTPRRWPRSASNQKVKSRFSHVVRRSDFEHYRVYSAWHEIRGFKWRLLIFPKGNKIDGEDITDMSVYLDCGGPIEPIEKKDKEKEEVTDNDDDNKSDSSADGDSWKRDATFSLHLMKARLLNDKLDGSAEAAKVAGLEGDAPPLMMTGSTGSMESVLNEEMCGVCKDSSHVFTERVSDWGFLEFVPLSTLEEGPYADADGNIIIMVGISIRDDVPRVAICQKHEDWLEEWNSKEKTGYVGLKSSGSTGYLNCVLQTWYSVGALRAETYRLPVSCDISEGNSERIRALRKLFRKLERSETAPDTEKLSTAFGWDHDDLQVQHDVHELKVTLFDAINQTLTKNTPNTINSFAALFEGTLENVINCVNVDYKSVTEETFYDLWLNVRGCRDIYESFEKYTEVEEMDKDNKYHAEGLEELQEARKYIKFKKLPSVLQLFLRRSRYNTSRGTTVKVNDRYEFDKEIDLSQYVENSDGSDRFVLQSVIVHEDELENTGGFYYVFVRTDFGEEEQEYADSSMWLRFENRTVTRADDEAAIQGSFGVGGEKDSSAYVLQYLRKSELSELLPAGPCDIESTAESDAGNESPAASEGGHGSEAEDTATTAASEAGNENVAPNEAGNESPAESEVGNEDPA